MPFEPLPFDSLPEAGRYLRIRREAVKRGLRAVRTRWRLGTPDNQGGWSILDARQKVVAGRNYEMSDNEALAFLTSQTTERPR